MQFLDRLCGVLRFLRPLAEEIRGAAQQLLLPIGDLIGMHIELLDQLGQGQPPPLDCRQNNLGLELGGMVRLFRFIASLQSLLLMMEEALICVQLLSNQVGPALTARRRCAAVTSFPPLALSVPPCRAQPQPVAASTSGSRPPAPEAALLWRPLVPPRP